MHLAALTLASLLVVDEPAAPLERATPAPPDRVAVALSSGLGGVVGGLLGSSLALASAAALAGYNEAARALPVVVLPSTLASLGAGVGGAAAGSERGAWAGALTALAGAGAASLAIGLAVLEDSNDAGTDPFEPMEMLAVVGAPAAIAGVGAGAAAALFVEEDAGSAE